MGSYSAPPPSAARRPTCAQPSAGDRNPIGRFEDSLGDLPEAVRRAFYADNFLRLLPSAASLAS